MKQRVRGWVVDLMTFVLLMRGFDVNFWGEDSVGAF